MTLVRCAQVQWPDRLTIVICRTMLVALYCNMQDNVGGTPCSPYASTTCKLGKVLTYWLLLSKSAKQGQDCTVSRSTMNVGIIVQRALAMIIDGACMAKVCSSGSSNMPRAQFEYQSHIAHPASVANDLPELDLPTLGQHYHHVLKGRQK